MTLGALILAGGAGKRMGRGSKPLVEVRGATLLERNVCALIGAGLRDIWIACREAVVPEIVRLATAACARGVAIRPILEAEPLGTIGAAAGLNVEALVTVNADNLTAIDLPALIAHHAGADLTLATHDHAIQLPYGAIDVDGDRVTAYREKPALVTRIASAVCVLGPRALAAIAGRTSLPELTQRLLDGGAVVRAYHHAAPWIDVNTPDDVTRAEVLVASSEDLECWARPPDLEVAGAIVRSADHLLLELRDGTRWDTPGGKLEAGEPPAAAIVRELAEELGVTVAPGRAVARFDMLEPDGRALRHHVFAPAVRRADVTAREGQTLDWFPVTRLPAALAPVVRRSLACERTG